MKKPVGGNYLAGYGLALLLVSGPVVAQTIDFESPVYITEKTIVDIDAWAMVGNGPTDLPNNYTIQSASGNKWLHCLTNGVSFIHRYVPAHPGVIDLRWRWRAMNDSASLCLGTAGNTGGTGIGTRAQVCMEAMGRFRGLGLQSITSTEKWTAQTWYYMHMLLDAAANQYTLFVSTDSLRLGEHVAIPVSDMNSVGPLLRVFLRSQNGTSSVDVDDISWENLSFWRANGDNAWATAKNWSTGIVPDSLTHVIFDKNSPVTCSLNKNAQVKSISMASAWQGAFNMDGSMLTVLGNADFSGGTFTFLPTASIHLASPMPQSLQSPIEGQLPHIVHDGTGTLRLDTRPLIAYNLAQLQGSLNLNGQNINVLGRLIIKNGKPGTLQNLDGRSFSVGKSAHFEGVSPDTLLGLVSSPALGQTMKGWTISVPSSDTLSARFAVIGNSKAIGATGNALQSSDAGNNAGWKFGSPPNILAPPRDTTVKIGQPATFKISVSSAQAVSYQWLRNDQIIANAKDSIYVLAGAKRSDSGAAFSCRITSLGGSITSAAANLTVVFPPPSILPLPKQFTDSLTVTLSTTIFGARILYSRNDSSFQECFGSVVLKDSTRLKAFAVLGSDTSGTDTWVYPKLSLSQVEAPAISPDPATPFLDSQVITISSDTRGSIFYYTLDESDPDSTTNRYTGPFTIRATTTVSARAYKTGYRPSDVLTHIYLRKTTDTSLTLGKPQANPPGGDFNDSIVVAMTPPASAPDASLYYSFGTSGLLKYSDPIVLRTSGTLKIIAIKGSTISDTVAYAFSRRLDAPNANPKAKIFHDSLLIALSSNIQGASIHYTWDGSDPTASSPPYPGVPILLDSSATLKAIAIKGTSSSSIMSESYTLIADTVRASFGSGDYASKIKIELQSSSKRALIYYSLDGSIPGPENGSQPYTNPFWIDNTTTLTAVAVTGHGNQMQRSPLLIALYSFITPGQRIIGPGQKLDISSNYSLNSLLPGASPVVVDVLRTDSLSLLKGFRDIQFAIRLSLPQGSTAFPSLLFKAPKGEPRALYQLVGANTVNYLTDADAYTFVNPGTYFLALDTLAPQIILSSETFAANDSTKVIFSIQDNVSNLLLDLTRSDNPARNLVAQSITSPEIKTVNLKNPAGSIQSLSIKLTVDDHHQKSGYPPDPGAVHLVSQKTSGPVRTPSVFQIGSQASNPWDLISFPLLLDPPITLAELKKNNSAPGLEAVTWDSPTGKYRYLKDSEALIPGASIWMAAASSMASLVFPSLQTVPSQEKGGLKIILHKGWNQVANPTLSTLYWPVTRAIPAIYDQSPLKGLNGYDAISKTYVHSDSLLPWRGYFAYYKGSRDTTIVLKFKPMVPDTGAVLAPKVAAMEGFTLTLGMAEGPALRLGAIVQAQDGLGWEDESRPPVQGEQGAWLWSAQGKTHLETDIRHWTPGALYTWNVVARAPTQSLLARIQEPVLPVGYAAWAISKTRGLRFALKTGAGIPMYPGLVDSFVVWAGPAAELEARLASVPLSVSSFQLQISTSPGDFTIHLHLPEAALVHWALFRLEGRVCASGSQRLAEGIYHLASGAADSGLPTGIYVLSLDWTSQNIATRSGSSGHLSRKIIIP